MDDQTAQDDQNLQSVPVTDQQVDPPAVSNDPSAELMQILNAGVSEIKKNSEPSQEEKNNNKVVTLDVKKKFVEKLRKKNVPENKIVDLLLRVDEIDEKGLVKKKLKK